MILTRLLRTRALLRPTDGLPNYLTLDTLPLPLPPNPDPLIGVAAHDTPVYLTRRHSHALAVIPPGFGSSTLLRTLAVQYAATGTRVDIIDVHHEHAWASAVPAITLWHDADDIRVFLQNLLRDLQPPHPTPRGYTPPQRVLLIETAGNGELLAFRRGPGQPGALIDRLVTLLRVGRGLGLQIVMAAYTVPQPLHANVRDLFRTRLVIQPSYETWYRLSGPGNPPRMPGRPGRALLMAPDASRTDLQLLTLTGQQALDLAAGVHLTHSPLPGAHA